MKFEIVEVKVLHNNSGKDRNPNITEAEGMILQKRIIKMEKKLRATRKKKIKYYTVKNNVVSNKITLFRKYLKFSKKFKFIYLFYSMFCL